MSKYYYEFKNASALQNELKFWSNACGELHHHGEYDLNDASQLPEELQYAYKNLWHEGGILYNYLAEYLGKYYIAIICEADKVAAEDCRMTMDKLYEVTKTNAIALYNTYFFKDTILLLGKATGYEERHEIIFLVPAMEEEGIFNEIEKDASSHIFP